MAGIFGEFFLVSVSHETKHENSSKNSGENSAQNSGQNSGRKFENFGALSFCDFYDLSVCVGGYCTIITRYVAKWGVAQMCLCETKYQGGGIAPLVGGCSFFAYSWKLPAYSGAFFTYN